MRAFLAVLAALLILSSGARASEFWDEVRTPGLRDYERHLREARAAAAAGDWEAARAEAEAAIARIDDRPEAHVVRGRALGELGRLDTAMEEFRMALALDDRALDAPPEGAHAARIAASAGEYGLAARILPRVLGIMPPSGERADLYALYGDVLLTLGPEHLRSAIVAYREAVSHGGRGTAQATIGLALALRRAGEHLESEDLAREVATRGRLEAFVAALPLPEPERAARRAIALEAIGDLSGARQAWEEAKHWEPWRLFTLRQLGREPDPEFER